MAESPEEKHIKLLYAIIKQKCLRDVRAIHLPPTLPLNISSYYAFRDELDVGTNSIQNVAA